MSGRPVCPLCGTADIAADDEAAVGFAHCYLHGVYRRNYDAPDRPGDGVEQPAAELLPDAIRLYYPDVADDIAAVIAAARAEGYRRGYAEAQGHRLRAATRVKDES